jgi:hypothetical protein
MKPKAACLEECLLNVQMTAEENLLPAWLGAMDSRRASQDYEWLISNLNAPCFAETETLVSNLQQQKEFHCSVLRRNFAVCKAVERFGDIAYFAGEALAEDPGMVGNAASLLHVMLQAYELEDAPKEILAAIESAHVTTLKSFSTNVPTKLTPSVGSKRKSNNSSVACLWVTREFRCWIYLWVTLCRLLFSNGA